MTGKFLLISLNLLIEFVCFSLAFLNLRKELSWKLFIPYLGFVLIIESIGAYYTINNDSSSFVYYPFLPVMVIFYFYQLSAVIGFGRKMRRFIYVLAILLISMLLGEYWEKGINQTPAFFIISNNLIVTVFCFYYLQNIFRSEEYESPIVPPHFWIIVGLLIHNFGSLGCFIFIDLLNEIRMTTGLPVRQIIMLFLNFCLYGFWGYAFICNKYHHSKLSL